MNTLTLDVASLLQNLLTAAATLIGLLKSGSNVENTNEHTLGALESLQLKIELEIRGVKRRGADRDIVAQAIHQLAPDCLQDLKDVLFQLYVFGFLNLPDMPKDLLPVLQRIGGQEVVRGIKSFTILRGKHNPRLQDNPKAQMVLFGLIQLLEERREEGMESGRPSENEMRKSG
jgi:hypothetical protein